MFKLLVWLDLSFCTLDLGAPTSNSVQQPSLCHSLLCIHSFHKHGALRDFLPLS